VLATPPESASGQPSAASVSPTASASALAPLAVPAAFSPVSVTAIGPSQWWVLGSDGLVAATSDGGTTFALTSLDGLGRNALQLRFANGSDGWAVTGASASTSTGTAVTLWSTTDAGRTWSGVRGLDGAVASVEAGGSSVFATVQRSDGTWSVWSSPISKNAWRKLGSLGAIVPTQRPLLAVQSGHAFVVGSNLDRVRTWVFSPDGTQTELAVPCTPDLGTGDLSATISSVWLVCHAGTADSLYRSTNATTWTPVPAASPASRLRVGAIDATHAAVGLQDGTIRLVSGASSTSTVAGGFPPTLGGWTYVAFTNTSDGFALEYAGALLRTTDGGLTWHTVKFR
jgi:photosystem II stability/assembly factor-like uncharacterized protein